MRPSTHVLSLSSCEVWAIQDFDGSIVYGLHIDTPENGITLTGEDIRRLARASVFLAMPPLETIS